MVTNFAQNDVAVSNVLSLNTEIKLGKRKFEILRTYTFTVRYIKKEKSQGLKFDMQINQRGHKSYASYFHNGATNMKHNHFTWLPRPAISYYCILLEMQ